MSAHLFAWRHPLRGRRHAGTKLLVGFDLDGALLPGAVVVAFSSRGTHARGRAIMTYDDDFEPRLGKIRSRGSKRGKRYLQQVLRAAALAGGRSRGGQRTKRGAFQGNRIGRGAGAGRVLASRDRYAAFRARRVVVKTRIVKMAGKGVDAARLHLRYIQRDGVTREGEPGTLYDATKDRADGKAFLARSEGDRHQFRFIIAAEDGVEYEDLKDLTRQLMQSAEEDLSTRLDWVAVDHYNTGHPHTHIVLRGKDETGRDLVIAREYLTHGLRARAAELVTLDLGPRTDLEIETGLQNEVGQERFTSLDRSLLREAGEGGTVEPRTLSVAASEHERFRHALRMGRLRTLERLGLAEETAPGAWRLSDALEATLRRMGERGDIIKALHREMAREGRPRGAAECAIYDPVDPEARRLIGRVVARGLSDEINDRHYLIIDGVDGRAHWVEIGPANAVEPIPEGAVVAIAPKRAEARAVDRTIAEIAAVNGGRYSIALHLQHDPTVSAEFVQSHVRRLEMLRRNGRVVERAPDASWTIPPDHLERAIAFERALARTNPVVVETLSALPLAQQMDADGSTWLDRELVSDSPASIRDAGFGKEVRSALARRRQWLIEQQLAEQQGDRIIYRRNLLELLRRRELTRVAAQLAGELGLAYAEARPGERIEGVYKRRIDLASGRFAMIEKSREFTLVPWRPVLERNLGKPVAGIVRGDTISWTLERQRGGPSIS